MGPPKVFAPPWCPKQWFTTPQATGPLVQSLCVCVCVCVECAVVHVRVAGAAILGALRADQSALYPYMAHHGASPYRREVPPLIFVYSLGIGDTYGGPRSGLCGRCQRST